MKRILFPDWLYLNNCNEKRKKDETIYIINILLAMQVLFGQDGWRLAFSLLFGSLFYYVGGGGGVGLSSSLSP